MTSQACRLVTGSCLLAVLAAGPGGCVGSIRSEFAWGGVATTDLGTKAEVVARFGEPRRKVHEGAREVWYYYLTAPGPSGRRPLTEAPNSLFALVVPIWWMSRPDANVRFEFEGETLVSAAEATSHERTFYCGINLVHGRDVLVCASGP